MTYGLLGKITARPGRRDELVGCLLQAAKLLENDPVCIHYAVGTTEDPDAVWASDRTLAGDGLPSSRRKAMTCTFGS